MNVKPKEWSKGEGEAGAVMAKAEVEVGFEVVCRRSRTPRWRTQRGSELEPEPEPEPEPGTRAGHGAQGTGHGAWSMGTRGMIRPGARNRGDRGPGPPKQSRCPGGQFSSTQAPPGGRSQRACLGPPLQSPQPPTSTSTSWHGQASPIAAFCLNCLHRLIQSERTATLLISHLPNT